MHVFFLPGLTHMMLTWHVVINLTHVPRCIGESYCNRIDVTQIWFKNLDFSGPVTATITTIEKKSSGSLIGQFSSLSIYNRSLIGCRCRIPLASVRLSHFSLPGVVCRGVQYRNYGSLSPSTSFPYGQHCQRIKDILRGREDGELVVVVASSVSTLVALRTACSLRVLNCTHGAS